MQTAPPLEKTYEDIAAAYRSPPWWYDTRGFFILTFAYHNSLPAQLRFFGRNMGPRHLEVACGTGTLLAMALRWRRWKGMPDSRVVGLDCAESMLAGAVRRFRRRPEVELRRGDAVDLPFPADSFDTVNLANSFHCLPAVDPVLAEVLRVLRPGGTLAANVLLHPRGRQPLRGIAGLINRWGIRKGILHATYARDDALRRLAEAGFELVSESVSGSCLDVLARKPT